MHIPLPSLFEREMTWQRREALYALFHNWLWWLGCCAVGALTGWLLSFVWPSYQRATQVVYVGLNPYRAYSDSGFLALSKPKYANLDNYHYWQMSQLNTFVASDRVLQATLDELQAGGGDWQTASLDDLRSAVSAEWRTAGEWELRAIDARPPRARQLVEAWSAAAAQQVQAAAASSLKVIAIDQQLQAATAQLQQAQVRQERLAAGLPRLQASRAQLAAAAALDPAQRWAVTGDAWGLAGPDPAWQVLLAAQPPAEAAPAQLAAWLDQVIARAGQDEAQLPAQTADMQQQVAALTEAFQAAQQDSAGLSPNLSVERIGQPELDSLRPAALLALVGAVIGLCVGLGLVLARLGRSGHSA